MEDFRTKYELVIGLEVHAQLATKSKMFASDSTEYGQAPNSQISEITLGYPGTLPKVNEQALEFAVRMGLACNCEISTYNIFDRKNYFYPDLPKGYQITQDKSPICLGGSVPIVLSDGKTISIPLNRIHMEEDAGKSIHADGEVETLVDYNRAGTPLIEIVTEPAMHSGVEASTFLSEIRKLVMFLGICDGNMEEGSLRCDANISVRQVGDEKLGKKVEVKNMNSFRNVSKAIEHEYERQAGLLERGEEVISETRTFDDNSGTTAGMRTKEELNDYRYFPEPDLSPVVLSQEWIDEIKNSLPRLPREYFEEFVNDYGMSEYDAQFLSETQSMAEYFSELRSHTEEMKSGANWIMGPVKSALNESGKDIYEFEITPKRLSQLIELVNSGKVSFSSASQAVFPEMISSPSLSPLEIAEGKNIIQDSDEDSLLPIVKEVLAENSKKVKEFKSGKKGLMGMFMGQVMRKSQGKADPKIATKLLTELLNA